MSTTNLITLSNFLDPSSVTIVSLFSASNFTIPDYQRDYSWTGEEVQQLWDDVVSTSTKCFTSAGVLVSNPAPHFMGAIVVQTYPTAQNRTPEVMDGQQRLVTLAAFFSVLCEFSSELTQASERDIWTASLKQLLFSHIAGNKVPKLVLARDDLHYKELVCNRFTRAERDLYLTTVTFREKSVLGRLKACTEMLHASVLKYLGPVGNAGRDAKLIQLLKTLMELIVVLQMKVVEQGVAYEVFESLNARGLDLQQADLLKNRLYAMAESQGTKMAVGAAWSRTAKAIEQQSMVTLTEFLHFHLVSKHRDAKLSDLYKHVLDHLGAPGVNAKDYAEDTAKMAEALQQILEAGSSFTPAVNRDVESIRSLITNKYALTLLISGATKHLLGSAEMSQVIKSTHHYVFRRFVVENISVGAYSSEITKVARDYATGAISNPAGLTARLGSLSTQVSFEAKFKDFEAPSNKVGFYVLEMIENHLTGNAGTMVQRQSVSQHLEHIMPKKATPADWAHMTSDPNYADLTNRIGNLLVLEANINTSVKNKAFAFKDANVTNRDYQHSQMDLPRTVKTYLKAGLWTAESIKERQSALVTSYAKIVWDL
jgi:hypothetical protein